MKKYHIFVTVTFKTNVMHVYQIRNLILVVISFSALYYIMGMVPDRDFIKVKDCWYERTILPDGTAIMSHADTCSCSGSVTTDNFEFK